MYPTKKLGEICEIITGSTPKTSNLDFFGGDILWAGPADIGEEKYIFKTNKTLTDKGLFDGKARLVKKGSVLLVAIGTIGKVSIAGSDLTTNQQIHALQTEKNIIPEFLYYCLLSNKEKLKNQASSAVLAILNKSRLSNFLIPLPPLSTQKLIVEKLDMIFAEIEKSKNLLEKNLQNVDEMNKSVLEKIFANDKWERKKLGEVCDFNYGKAFPAGAKNITGNFPVYGANGIMYMGDNFLIDAQSIIVGRKGSVGALTKTSGKFWVSDVAYYVIEKQNTVLDFLYYFLKKSNLQQFARGVKPGLNRNEVYNLKIPLPPLETQKLIVEKLDNIFAENQKLKNLYQAQIKNLDEMKQSFLKKAFAGELV
ncbi:restriction endonuclease subunit S [Candidatus Gracilibacteria bacterium]|nr:MAG: restriction endonuclease subunit S [Candidatus Gracilibacteria bacterium]